jgi:hypothetical protein
MVNSNLRKVSSECSPILHGGLHVLYNTHIEHLVFYCKLICVKHKEDLVRNATTLLELWLFRTIDVHTLHPCDPVISMTGIFGQFMKVKFILN